MSTGKQKKYIRHPDKYIRNPDKPFVSAFLPGFKNEDFSGSFISVIFTDFPEKSLPRTEKIEKNFNPGLQKQKILAYYGMFSSGRSSVVEHHVANVMVEGSNPFTRSIFFPILDCINFFRIVFFHFSPFGTQYFPHSDVYCFGELKNKRRRILP